MVPKGDSSDNFIGGGVYSSQSYGSRIGTINKGHDIWPKQSVTKVEIHDTLRITEGSDYKVVWYSRTVHKTIGHFG